MIVIAFRIDGKSPIQPENQQLIGLPQAVYRCRRVKRSPLLQGLRRITLPNLSVFRSI